MDHPQDKGQKRPFRQARSEDASAPGKRPFNPSGKFGPKSGGKPEGKFGAKSFDKGPSKGGKPAPGKGSAPVVGARIAKVLARIGIASRREVERLIGLGQVTLNGRILDTPATLVGPEDVVAVDGKVVGAAEPTRVFRYHKPVGLITTHSDPKNRDTVFANLPENLPRVISVGRLDLNSEGLLLLTNDGELARLLELPASKWVRQYRVRAMGRIDQAKLDTLKAGIEVEGVTYGPIEARLDKAVEKPDGRANIWISVSLQEGKNREIRRVFEALGLKVNRLIRLAYGPFALGDLALGQVEEVGPRVIAELMKGILPAYKLPSREAKLTPAEAPSEDNFAGRRGGGARFSSEKPAHKGRPTSLRTPRPEGSAPRAYGPKAFKPREQASHEEGGGRREGGFSRESKPYPSKPYQNRGAGSDRDGYQGAKPNDRGTFKPRFDADRAVSGRSDTRRDGPRPYGSDRSDRPARSDGNRPERRDSRAGPAKPWAAKSGEDRGARPREDRPNFSRPRSAGPREDRPSGAKPDAPVYSGERKGYQGKRPAAPAKSASKAYGDKPTYGKPRDGGDRPTGNRDFGSRGERPREDRPREGAPRSAPFGAKRSGPPRSGPPRSGPSRGPAAARGPRPPRRED